MEALIVLFASGLISLFIAFAKKPALVVTSALLGLAATTVLIVNQITSGKALIELNYAGLHFDYSALMYGLATTILTGVMIGIGYEKFKDAPNHTGEYIGLLLISSTGALIMFAFTDMFMFFLGLEILSIPIYVMAGSNKGDLRSNESSLKYFLTGSFATGIILFGIAWIYGATGSFNLAEIGSAAAEGADNSLLLVGILLILSAFLFKVGAAPFHFWSPDVYDGAPHAVTGFMASVVKLAAFGAFLKLFVWCFGTAELKAFWGPALAILIVLTLFVGNLSALRQVTLKRMLAYSSITHVGYTLMVILTSSISSVEDLWFYMFAYGFSIAGIIAVGIAVNDEEDKIEALKGLGQRNPFLAFVGILSVLSLAGIPLTSGFFGKYMVFSAAWKEYWWLVIIALINSAISIYYYLKLITAMMSKSDEPQEKITISPLTALMLAISIVGMLGLTFITASI
ncbi:MAG: NADH-quinone oxidoreductase subunit N [Fluviicola sp.]